MAAKRGRLGRRVALSVLLWLPVASAQQTSPRETQSSALSRTLSVGIAAGVMRFDTNFKFTDRNSGRSVFIDAEGTMQLPEVRTIPLIYGYWRPSSKHGIGFGYFSIHRDSELIAIDRNFGDLSLFMGVNYFDGDITINDADLKTEIHYGFDGLLLGIDVGF